jgi:hypothetical protein
MAGARSHEGGTLDRKDVFKMRKYLLAPVFTAAVLLVLPAAAAAQATTTTTVIDMSVDGTTMPNPCTGETVTMSGSRQFVTHVTFDDAGGFHLKINQVNQGISAVSASGNEYRVAGGSHFERYWQGAAPRTETQTVAFQFISQGSADNFTQHAIFHFTVNANGEVTATQGEVRNDCSG